jgi:hypothetical protein
MQQDGQAPLYLKATTTHASWAMEELDVSFEKRFFARKELDQAEVINLEQVRQPRRE